MTLLQWAHNLVAPSVIAFNQVIQLTSFAAGRGPAVARMTEAFGVVWVAEVLWVRCEAAGMVYVLGWAGAAVLADREAHELGEAEASEWCCPQGESVGKAGALLVVALLVC